MSENRFLRSRYRGLLEFEIRELPVILAAYTNMRGICTLYSGAIIKCLKQRKVKGVERTNTIKNQ